MPVSNSVLENEIIYAIIEDNNKNMWITTSNSISNIIVSKNPETGQYTFTDHTYGELDGLQGQQFNMRSITKTHSGKIIAGGIKGLSFFDPDKIKYNYETPKIEFTSLQLFNEDVKIDSIYNGNIILTKAINCIEEIKLKYTQNVFSVSFSAMNYILPEKTQYMYILEGFNKNWQTTDVNNLTYTSLLPGEYILKVKAINSDGFSDQEISELKIIITPPFWATNVAYIIYFIILVSIVLLMIRQLLNNERQKFKLLQIEQKALQKHEVDEMKLLFFTNISHELRTPLTLIISPLEKIIKEIENKDQKNKLEIVQRNAVTLLRMVNQLLDFRKNEAQGHQLNLVEGDVVEFIRGISNSFIAYSEKKNVHLTFFTAIQKLWIKFDEDKIGKVVMNLLSNAFKFTPEGGRVELSMNLLSESLQQSELLEIRVSDNGISISDEDKKLIFDRFYQVQGKQKSSGSGIGLHLVKEFVTLHKGTVSVVDNIGKGSVFIVKLPILRAKCSQMQELDQIDEMADIHMENITGIAKEEQTKDRSDKNPVILIVDDNEDFRIFMHESLKEEYTIVEAADGTRAWSIIPELQPDVIVSDLMMPDTDGNELCRLVKNDIRTSHIPFILLTAHYAKEQKMEGLESGADDFITKPFDFDILILRIKRLLQLRQERQERFTQFMEINPREITITSLDEKLINKAIKYVEDNISRSDLSVEELSTELNISRVHLYKKMVSITGKTPIEFIRVIRLKRAAQYLSESQQNVSEIAYQTGFSNPKYFRKYFKEEFGVLPSDYQDKSVQKITIE